MKIGVTPFIKENTALPNAKNLSIFDGDKKICDVDISSMTPQNLGTKLYSVGLMSDIHLWYDDSREWNPNVKFDNALTYLESIDCAMCIVCGDLTQTGYYVRTNDSDPNTQSFDERQMAKYKEICDKHTIPIYEIAGNHESYYSQPIRNNLDKWERDTGKRELSYSVEQGDDLYIFCGHCDGVMRDDDFIWLCNTLDINRDKRCFVFVHCYIEEDSGDPKDFRENSSFDDWKHTDEFIKLLNQHPNVILFHGHSHMKFECQEMDKNANYTTKNGFKSVHIPSTTRPRNIDLDAANPTPYANDEGQGYIVDVYANHIVLNGYDVITNKLIPIAQYCIDTSLKTHN